MALLFVDGFDHYDTSHLLSKWSDAYSSPVIQSTVVRTGSGALRLANSAWINKGIPLTTGAIIVGLAYRISSLSNSTWVISFGNSNWSDQCNVYLGSDGSLSFRRYTTVLQTSNGGVINAGNWYYVEAKAVVADSGSWEVRVNGETVLSGTGDTLSSGSAGCSMITIRSPSSYYAYFDDLYICDTTGSYCNDFLGDSQVDTLYPNEDGAVVQWTPSSGSSHYSLVDDSGTIDESDYVYTSTLNAVDVYGLTDLSLLGTDVIHAVVVNSAAQKTESGDIGLNGVVRISSTNYYSNRLAVLDSVSVLQGIFMRNPATSTAWTRDAVNGIQAGVRLVS